MSDATDFVPHGMLPCLTHNRFIMTTRTAGEAHCLIAEPAYEPQNLPLKIPFKYKRFEQFYMNTT